MLFLSIAISLFCVRIHNHSISGWTSLFSHKRQNKQPAAKVLIVFVYSFHMCTLYMEYRVRWVPTISLESANYTHFPFPSIFFSRCCWCCFSWLEFLETENLLLLPAAILKFAILMCVCADMSMRITCRCSGTLKYKYASWKRLIPHRIDSNDGIVAEHRLKFLRNQVLPFHWRWDEFVYVLCTLLYCDVVQFHLRNRWDWRKRGRNFHKFIFNTHFYLYSRRKKSKKNTNGKVLLQKWLNEHNTIRTFDMP